MIKHFYGDILSAPCDIVTHQVNCLGIAGAGLAKHIRNSVDGWYDFYRQDASPQKLGEINLYHSNINNITICSIYGQLSIGTNKQQTDYNAIEKAFIKLSQYLNEEKVTIAIPYKMGCGLGGGNWDVVQNLIKKHLNKYDILICHLQ